MLFETWFDPSYARKSFIPLTNETLALGSSSVRWSNVYSKVFNVSDGTRLGVLQSNSNGVEVGSTSNHNLRFLLANTAVAQWIYGASDPTLRFIGNGIVSNTDNTQVLSIGAGAAAINTSGAHLIFIGNSYGGAGAGNASIGTGNASGANFDIGVWSTNGSFRVYVASAANLALAVNYARNLLLYNGIIFNNPDPTILYSTDASSVSIGGGSTIADTSGAGLVLYGISHATKAGGFILGTANSSTAFGDFRAPHASGYFIFSIGGTERWRMTSNILKAASANALICMSTSDGFDNGYIQICGGGGLGNSRGAQITFRGNEDDSGNGLLEIHAGNASGGYVSYNGYVSAGHRFYISGVEKIRITDNVFDYLGTMGNSTKVVGTDAPADWVEIKIGGTQYFLPAYAA